jgi:Domain of unknown function (DUF4440)
MTGMLRPSPLLLLLLLSFGISTHPALATEPALPSSELYKKIAELDRELFEGFNACDMATMRNLMEPEVEFYQDNDTTTYSRDQLEPSFRDRCGANNVSKLRRELIPGSMEVYPLKDYGALEIAKHDFFIMEDGKKGNLAASPNLILIWRNDHGHWAVTRVISYGH